MAMTNFPYAHQTYTRNPGSFSDVYNSPLGRAFWAFLTRPENVLLLEGATLLKQPAIVVLWELLVNRFGPNLGAARAGKSRDRIKQGLGTMVRDIMISLGYSIDRQGVSVRRFGGPFVTATRYT